MASRNTGEPDRDVAQGTPMAHAMTGKEAGTVMPAEQDSPSAPPLRDQAADIGRRATERARTLVHQAQSTTKEKLERSKHDAATTLTSVATTLLQSGTQLRDREQPMAGEYLERAARQIERAANYVENADVGDMVNQVDDFARRRPALFIGTAFAAGLLVARFLKNSRRVEQRSSDRVASNRYVDREVPPPGTTGWSADRQETDFQ